MENKEKNETQNRREFFKEAAKKALPIIGAVALMSNPIISNAMQKEKTGCDNQCAGSCGAACTTCWMGCSGTCQSCHQGCAEGCSGKCNGACRDNCDGRCTDGCRGGCGWQEKIPGIQ